eukprot:CAMPEP_0119550622 /NCGR_PEP_ID=MMETSP1352-20130426/4096_1 /TAXON_ID=265584 /ORGANISM="Stauroneis constricta, Strain CCMP1120" /LENGTH=426 /DNA_ID=CAMNT_0007596521 /DNA_START=236 /DNA_END=1516 /DNA_ORIENTATION=+
MSGLFMKAFGIQSHQDTNRGSKDHDDDGDEKKGAVVVPSSDELKEAVVRALNAYHRGSQLSFAGAEDDDDDDAAATANKSAERTAPIPSLKKICTMIEAENPRWKVPERRVKKFVNRAVKKSLKGKYDDDDIGIDDKVRFNTDVLTSDHRLSDSSPYKIENVMSDDTYDSYHSGARTVKTADKGTIFREGGNTEDAHNNDHDDARSTTTSKSRRLPSPRAMFKRVFSHRKSKNKHGVDAVPMPEIYGPANLPASQRDNQHDNHGGTDSDNFKNAGKGVDHEKNTIASGDIGKSPEVGTHGSRNDSQTGEIPEQRPEQHPSLSLVQVKDLTDDVDIGQDPTTTDEAASPAVSTADDAPKTNGTGDQNKTTGDHVVDEHIVGTLSGANPVALTETQPHNDDRALAYKDVDGDGANPQDDCCSQGCTIS